MEVNVKEILNMLGIQYKDKGSYFNSRCPSPGHSDKSPSWNIRKDTGVHHCFSCGYKGNLITLVKELTGQKITEFLNIQDISSYKFKNTRKNAVSKPEEKKDLVNIEGSLYQVYDNDQVMDYLKVREIHDDFIEYYKLMYCTKILINGTYFSNRVCIPVYEDTLLKSMEGRDFTNKQKPKVLYPKNASVSTLFNIDHLDKNETLYVVEGIMHLIPLFNRGYRNITCTFGSAISNRQKELLLNFNDIILIPDGDDAGRKMIANFENFMLKEFYIVIMPEGKDPDDCPRKKFDRALMNKILSVDYILKINSEFQFKSLITNSDFLKV